MDDNKVAVLLEDLMSKFRTFGEGLQMLDEKMDRGFETLDNRMDKMDTRMDRMEIRMDHMESKMDRIEADNQRDHKQIIQAIQDLNSEVKRLDTEVVQIKRVK